MNHYVYRITEIETKMYYYGDKSCEEEPKDNIGKTYFSSFSNKLFQLDQKQNPQRYKYKVIKVFKSSDGYTRKDAKDFEVKLHKKFNVKNHPRFINRANQTSSGFDTMGISFIKTEEHQNKINNSLKGKKRSKKQKQNISEGIIKTKHLREFLPTYGMLGKSHSDETKNIMTEKAKTRDNTNITNSLPRGESHSATKTIQIFNKEGIIQYTSTGSFTLFCKNNNLPHQQLSKSFKENIRMYNNKRSLAKAKQSGLELYEGWFAKVLI